MGSDQPSTREFMERHELTRSAGPTRDVFLRDLVPGLTTHKSLSLACCVVVTCTCMYYYPSSIKKKKKKPLKAGVFLKIYFNRFLFCV